MNSQKPSGAVSDTQGNRTPISTTSDKRYDLGVLVVHGIGQQRKGETLNSYASAIYEWVRDRVQGVREGHRLRHDETREGLSKLTKLTPQSVEAAAQQETHVDVVQGRRCISYLESLSAFLPASETRQVGHSRVSCPDGEPLMAHATLSHASANEKDTLSTAVLELDWTDSIGENHSARWLIAESWWAEAFVPPKLWDLFSYAPIAVPLTVLIRAFWSPQSYVKSGEFRNVLREVQYPIRLWLLIGVSIFAAPLVYLVLSAAQVFSWIPMQKFQSAAQALRSVLIGVVGDAVAFAKNPSTRAALITRVERDLELLAGQCKSVLLVGHSQGAMLAYLASRTRPKNVKGLLTLGSAIRILRTLIHATETQHDWDRAARGKLAIAQLAALGALTALGAVMFGSMALGTGAVLGSVCSVLALATGLLGISTFVQGALASPLEDEFWQNRMAAEHLQWLDLAASHDPVAVPLDYEFIVETEGEFHLPRPRSIQGQDTAPVTRVVTNGWSMLRDHIGYLANREECVSALVSLCAELDGAGSNKWLLPRWTNVGRSLRHRLDDPPTQNGESVSNIGFARGHIVRRASVFRRAAVLAIVALVVVLRLDLLRQTGDLLLSRPSLRQAAQAFWSVFQVRDLALATVAVSAILAVGSAARYALRRLTVALLERRNPHLLKGYATVSTGEWSGLVVSGLLPLLLLPILWRCLPNWTLIIATLICTLTAHLVANYLRLFCSGRERKMAFAPPEG